MREEAAMNTTITLRFPFKGEDEEGVFEDDVPALVEVEWEGEPDVPGCRSGHPDNWTPDEPGYTEIISMALFDDVPELNLKAGDKVSVDQVLESEREIERMVVESHEPDFDFDEPDDYDDYDDPSHDYIYEGPSWA